MCWYASVHHLDCGDVGDKTVVDTDTSGTSSVRSLSADVGVLAAIFRKNYFNSEHHRIAADLAIFYVLLCFEGPVDGNFKLLVTIWTPDICGHMSALGRRSEYWTFIGEKIEVF